MPTTLVLYYTACVEVTVPNKIARHLKKQEGVQNYDKEAWAFGNKWGNLYYQGEDGKDHKIEGTVHECDYKYTENGEWYDEQESEDEEEEEDDCVIPQCCNDANGCPQCCSEEEEEEGEEGDQCEECHTKAATKCEMCGNSLCHYHTRGKDKESADLCKGCFGKEEEESK